jgi:hypothetical protein
MKGTLKLALCLAIPALLTIGPAGCGGSKSTIDDTNPITGGEQLQTVAFDDFRDLVEGVAPPTYTASSTVPADSSIWTAGDYPLLEKAFDANEPMSLYANVDNIDLSLTEIADFLRVDSLGNLSGDSSTAAQQGLTYQIIQLGNGAAIPTGYQQVIGLLRVDVENLVQVTWNGGDTKESHFGFTLNDSIQTVLCWNHYSQAGSNEVSTYLYYAHFNQFDSTLEIRGLSYKNYNDSATVRWVYDIEGIQPNDFSYRMSWYSNDFSGQPAIGTIVGGGDKQTEFALRYRQYTPPTSQSPDPNLLLDQTFGPNFTFGDTTIAASYNTYVNENRILKYNAFPQSDIESPWSGSQQQ